MGLAGGLFTMNKMSLTHQEKLTGLVGYGIVFSILLHFIFQKAGHDPLH